MLRRRGVRPGMPRVMAAQDFPVLQAANYLVSAVYLESRTLDCKTKELLFVLSLTVLRGEREHIASHIRVALEVGAVPREILEAIEIALPERVSWPSNTASQCAGGETTTVTVPATVSPTGS